MDRIQPVVEGPVGRNSTRRPVGTEGMFSASDSDRPTADGRGQTEYYPRVILIGRWLVGRFFKFGPKRMFSLDELNQPVAVGPVGHPSTPNNDSPVGSTGILDPVNQTGSPIQTL